MYVFVYACMYACTHACMSLPQECMPTLLEAMLWRTRPSSVKQSFPLIASFYVSRCFCFRAISVSSVWHQQCNSHDVVLRPSGFDFLIGCSFDWSNPSPSVETDKRQNDEPRIMFFNEPRYKQMYCSIKHEQQHIALE